MKKISFYLILALIALNACSESHDVKPKDYFSVVSLGITSNDDTGASFEARVQDIDQSTVIEHGFVWSRENDPRPDNAEFVKLGADLNSLTFNAKINSRLRQNRRYYVRAFVQSNEYTYLSDTVSFLSLGSQGPELTSFSPASANLADTVVLAGSGFSITMENNRVFFDDKSSSILRSSDDKIWAIVPQDLDIEESTIRVEVSGESSSYNTSFSLIAPSITGLSTDMTGLGETVEIFSDSPLPEDPALITVELEYLGGERFQISDEDLFLNPLRFKIPSNVSSGIFRVVLKYNNLEDVFSPPLQLRPPVITGFSETEVDYNQELIILGENFSPFQGKNLVWLDGKEIDIIESGVNSPLHGGADFIKIKIPPGYLRSYSSRQIGVRLSVLEQEFNASNALHIINPWFLISKTSFSAIESTTSTDAAGYLIDTDALYQFNFSNKEWTELSQMPREGVREPVSFVIGNDLYFGLGHEFFNTDARQKDFWKYSFSTGNWTQLGDFPGGERTKSMSFTAQGFGFVGGGSTESSAVNSDFWQYSSADDTWQQIGDYPIAINRGTATVTSNGVFAGYSQGGGNTLYEYDVAMDTWSQETELPFPSSNNSESTLVGEGDILYTGVLSNGTALYSYNTNTAEWKTLSVCPTTGKLLFAHEGKVYLSGGFFSSPNETWEYDPAFERN